MTTAVTEMRRVAGLDLPPGIVLVDGNARVDAAEDARRYVGRCHPDISRYVFDAKLMGQRCYQIDTDQDASYFGMWTSPARRVLVSFEEGNFDVTKHSSDAGYIADLDKLYSWSGARVDMSNGAPEAERALVARSTIGLLLP